MNKNQRNLVDALMKLAKKEGLEIKTINIEINPKVEKIVWDYIRKIEQAHKSAENSTLRFKYNNFQPVYS